MRSRTEYGVLVLLLVALISRWGRAEDEVPARPVGAEDSTAEDPVAATAGDDAARRERKPNTENGGYECTGSHDALRESAEDAHLLHRLRDRLRQ